MNIIEHDDNIVTKKASEIKKYLLRIIQRYFDMQNVETQNSIEAIIVESLTRMKRDIMHEKSFVFYINGVAGHVILTASDIGAESSFSKNTAFNKDFCVSNTSTPDTICEGNDPRLSDNRDPNQHNHNRYDNFIDKNGIPIVDANGNLLYKLTPGNNLNYLLDQAKLVQSDLNHYHDNYHKVLKRLRYTGTRSEIDLAYLSVVKNSLITLTEVVEGLANNFANRVDVALEGLSYAEEKIKEYYEILPGFFKIPPVWYDKSIYYIDTLVNNFKKHCQDCIDSGVTQQEFQDFIEDSKILLHCVETTIDNPVNRAPVSIEGNTACRHQVIQEPYDSTLGKIQRVDAYLKYDETINIGGTDTNITVDAPLPFIMKCPDGALIIITCTWSKDRVQIDSNVRYTVSFSLAQNMIFNNESIIVKQDNNGYPLLRDHIYLCLVDSSQKLQFIKNNIVIDKTYNINGNKYGENTEWTYVQGDKSGPLNYFEWDPSISHDTNLGENYGIQLQPNGFMRVYEAGLTDSDDSSLLEFIPPDVEDYFKNPRIYYKVYVGEGD